MKIAWALRPRITPSALSRTDNPALQPWRDPRSLQQHRSRSKTQYGRLGGKYGSTSAIYHGGETQPQSDSQLMNSPQNRFSQSQVVSHLLQKTQQRQMSSAPKTDHRQARSQAIQGSTKRAKRRAEQSPTPPPARRRRAQRETGPNIELKDEAYIRNHVHVPASIDYPNLPHTLFIAPRGYMLQKMQSFAHFKADFSMIQGRAVQCALTCDVKQRLQSEVVIGEGNDKKSAEKAAYLHLLARFHELDVINTFLDDAQVRKLVKQIQADEVNAIMDIYNYAARFDGTPKFDIQVVGRRPGKARKGVEVIVEFLEQNISVMGRGQDLKFAEVSAASKFKEQAEKYQAARGESSIVIKDSTALTTATCKDFIEFYKITYPKASVTVNLKLKHSSELKRECQLKKAQVEIDGSPVGEPVEMMTSNATAETLAFLTAAVALKKKDPRLYPKFIAALRAGNGKIIRPVYATEMPVDEDCTLVMRNTLTTARNAGLPDEAGLLENDEMVVGRAILPRHLIPMGQKAQKIRNTQLQEALSAYMRDPDLEKLRKVRYGLPMNQHRGEVLDLVNKNQYSIIVGATGSGKTTQVPQIIFEEAVVKGEGSACNIICTQPRRIAATSVARRVVQERNEKLQETVGYHVRFDPKLPLHRGSITYCTTGILTKQLQFSADNIMGGVSHIIIDEVHERDIIEDFLLIVLKKTIKQRTATGQPCPKIVLMSATMNTELFASYFSTNVGGDGVKDCPSITVPGRTFPVKELYLDSILHEMRMSYPASALSLLRLDTPTDGYLEASDRFCQQQLAAGLANTGRDALQSEESVIDWKQKLTISAEGELITTNDKDETLVPIGLVGLTVAHIAKTSNEGAFLVFLPGLEELDKVEKLLRGGLLGIDFSDESKFKIYRLHSSLITGQTEVFHAVPDGCRKVILATNIAETSITIPDVRFVVDTGKVKETRYDSLRRISQLSSTWISKSNSKQRAGRAGRVQDGIYYALFPKARYDWMRAVPSSELVRTDLQRTCLEIKTQAFKSPIREFLAEAIEPPPPSTVDASVMNLQALDALTADENLTSLGRLLGLLPVHPALGKVIILGVIFRCLDPMLTLGAALQETYLFSSPIGQRKEAVEVKTSFVQGTGSDHIATINAIVALRYQADKYGPRGAVEYARNNFIHFNTFKRINSTALQVEEILVDAGLIPFTPPSARRGWQLGDPFHNENSSKIPLIKALAIAAFHPNLAKNMSGRFFRTSGETSTMMHPASINHARHEERKERKESKESQESQESLKPGTLYTYSSLSRSSDNALFLRDTTECTPLMVALFGGNLSNPRRNVLEIDGWLPFKVKSDDDRAVKTIIEFRKALERVMSTAFRDLAVQQQVPGETRKTGQRTFLADEAVRLAFAKGLVDVLDRDVLGMDPLSGSGKWGPPIPENRPEKGHGTKTNKKADFYHNVMRSAGFARPSMKNRM